MRCLCANCGEPTVEVKTTEEAYCTYSLVAHWKHNGLADLGDVETENGDLLEMEIICSSCDAKDDRTGYERVTPNSWGIRRINT